MAKKYDNKIDVIIPAYNVSEKLLGRCLASVACQDILEDVEVTIVDDASEKSYLEGYQKLAKMFEPMVKVSIHSLEENKGPGVARQYGIDKTSHGLMTFIDADDTFFGSLALKVMRNVLTTVNNGKTCMVSCGFDEIHEDNVPQEHQPGPMALEHRNDMVWMFGKMYRRKFIDDNEIRFHPTSRANEDNGFNHCIQLISDDNNQIAFSPYKTYIWHETENSITRHSDCEYAFGSTVRDSFFGFCENMAYAINYALKRNPFNGNAQHFAAECMLIIYQYYVECVAKANEHAEQNFQHAKMYYNAVFRNIEKSIPEKILAEIYSQVMRNAYMGGSMLGFIPSMTIGDFLEKMKEE